MIDWEKPIETVDGRKVTVCRAVISRSGEGAKVVYVAPPPGAVFGDVFLVDEKGFRCDDSAPEEPVQIIRNVRVKREGWVVKYKDRDRLWDYRIFSSEEIAIENSPVQTVVVRIQWEE